MICLLYLQLLNFKFNLKNICLKMLSAIFFIEFGEFELHR